MMHYKKGKNVEEELTRENIPIEILPENYLWMHVKGGTKVTSVIDFAKKSFDSGEHRSVLWTGSGGGVVKTISCAEIFRRDYPVNQVTRLSYRKVEEFWDPTTDGLEQIVATRKIPCIHILQTLQDVDSKIRGYQAANSKTKFWVEHPPLGQNSSGEGMSAYNRGNSRKKNKSDQRNRNQQKDKQKQDKKSSAKSTERTMLENSTHLKD